MTHTTLLRSLVLSAVLTAGGSAFAQISFNIVVAPPAPLHEAAPTVQPGYAWAPGYWAWNNNRYVWVRGRTVMQRDGYNWVPDRWVQQNNSYVRQSGHWERHLQAKPVKVEKPRKPKHDKRDKHDNGRRDHGNSGK